MRILNIDRNIIMKYLIPLMLMATPALAGPPGPGGLAALVPMIIIFAIILGLADGGGK